MTYREAFNIIDGVELVVMNRNFDQFQSAVITALFLLDREAKKEEKKEKGEKHDAQETV